MEKKNTVLLTVIAVATLLVAVVGATFAYFTASTAGNGTGTAATGTTTSVGSVAFNYADTSKLGDIKYPGGMMVNAGKVTSEITGQGSFSGSYKVKATVDATALTSANTVVKATLYKLAAEPTGDLVGSCQMKTGTTSTAGETTYYYEGCAKNAAFTDAVKVAEAATTADNKTLTLTSKATDFTAISSTTAHTAYYYLVVEYVNNPDAAQNEDMGKSITVKIDGIVDAKSAAAAQ